MEIKRTQEEVDKQLEWAIKGIDEGTRYAGMSYEDGVRITIDWMTGFSDDRPDGEE